MGSFRDEIWAPIAIKADSICVLEWKFETFFSWIQAAARFGRLVRKCLDKQRRELRDLTTIATFSHLNVHGPIVLSLVDSERNSRRGSLQAKFSLYHLFTTLNRTSCLH